MSESLYPKMTPPPRLYGERLDHRPEEGPCQCHTDLDASQTPARAAAARPTPPRQRQLPFTFPK